MFFLLLQKNYGQIICTSKDSCISQLEYYSSHWKGDSLGLNGFRELFSLRVLKNCNYENRLWKQVGRYLGNPNFTFKKENFTRYRFRLNHYTEDIRELGSLLLDVLVNKEGIITQFIIWEVVDN